jgi:hypothetical protein
VSGRTRHLPPGKVRSSSAAMAPPRSGSGGNDATGGDVACRGVHGEPPGEHGGDWDTGIPTHMELLEGTSGASRRQKPPGSLQGRGTRPATAPAHALTCLCAHFCRVGFFPQGRDRSPPGLERSSGTRCGTVEHAVLALTPRPDPPLRSPSAGMASYRTGLPIFLCPRRTGITIASPVRIWPWTAGQMPARRPTGRSSGLTCPGRPGRPFMQSR